MNPAYRSIQILRREPHNITALDTAPAVQMMLLGKEAAQACFVRDALDERAAIGGMQFHPLNAIGATMETLRGLRGFNPQIAIVVAEIIFVFHEARLNTCVNVRVVNNMICPQLAR